MNSTEKLYKIYQEYEVKIEVGMNVYEQLLVTLIAYKDKDHYNSNCEFYGNGSCMDAAIDKLYDEIYTKKTAEQAD